MGKIVRQVQKDVFKMKVCFLITGLGIGGAEKHLLKLVPRLKFDKFVISLTNKKEIGKEIEKKGVRVYYLGLTPFIIFKFRKIIKKEKPDILDTYLIHANIFGRIFGRIFGIKKIVNSVRNDYSDLKLLNFLDRMTKGLVDLYIVNSKALIGYIHNKNKVSLKKIKLVPNGIDLKGLYGKLNKKYDIRDELKLPKKSFIIACAARLQKQKNLPVLIKSMKFVNEKTFLVIAGGGPEKKELDNIIAKLNLQKRVFLLGERKDISNIVNSSDIFVLPSLKEGMSNALLEAMALKKCCLVSSIPQNKELIKDKVNGFIFNPKNAKGLAKNIENACKSKKLADFGEKSYVIIKKKYQIDTILKKYEKIIEETTCKK
jgi:glycosyltransferase involved in cell wall biosynthesis